MTEHRKLPDPPKTLLERAESMFGLGGYTPAPVPSELSPPTNRRCKKRVKDMPPPPAAGADNAVPAAVREEQAEPVYEDVAFSDDIHEIDRDMLTAHGLIQPEGQVTALLEEFRIVKRRVLASVRKAREKGSGAMAQRVLVSSPLPNEGKSYCAANLALALAAERDSEVLLVDADFAKPSLLRMLGLPKGPGFMDVLARDDLNVEDCVLKTDVAGLYVLPAGDHTTADSEFLASHRTAEVLDRLTRAAPNRIVIFDSPPALAASPAAELANHVGQAIVVARADRTGQTALEDALTLLSACPDLKLLLNAAHFSPSGRRFGAYYGEEA
ncbi:AAA family ATPase [Aurantiacibacter gangjinensis]|uniref:Capsular biosynthesis protein n=1 Tax=Aurantiacibacter gangjinensis TaxID=502682 RepID=A0A0G9MQJ7_9SPHN|nr:AAA family ATPase [Aurantiacibacter gangjinensis]APE28872.1 Protein-tyrosine kinase [Aurantiacibacter gangjinensis]KLE33007.1 capsular biosynthesis protein [Aurantiacibacter gangjinensis]